MKILPVLIFHLAMPKFLMMNRILLRSTFLSLFLLPQLVMAARFMVRSEPSGAEVMVQTAQGGEKTKLGVTPLDVDHSQIDAITKGVAFKLELSKQGFDKYEMLVASTGKEDITWDAVLVPSVKEKGDPEIDVLISGLFEAQRLVRAKDYAGALTSLEILEKKFPNVSSVYELKGSVNYLKKDFNIALAEFRKAFTLNPQNKVAQQMKAYLESKVNIKDQL